MHKNLFIVIPVYNRREFTRKCLLSLQKQTFNGFTTVVVDDGSSDGTPQMIVTEFPEVVVLRGNGSLWWAGATNLGIQYALEHGARYIITLNDDTFTEPNFVSSMLYWSQRNPRALLGALAVDFDTRKTGYVGESINWVTACYRPASDLERATAMNGLQEVTVFSGRGLLIPAEVLHEI